MLLGDELSAPVMPCQSEHEGCILYVLGCQIFPAEVFGKLEKLNQKIKTLVSLQRQTDTSAPQTHSDGLLFKVRNLQKNVEGGSDFRPLISPEDAAAPPYDPETRSTGTGQPALKLHSPARSEHVALMTHKLPSSNQKTPNQTDGLKAGSFVPQVGRKLTAVNV